MTSSRNHQCLVGAILVFLFTSCAHHSPHSLVRLDPYDPEKIPVLCVQGLLDAESTWMPLVDTVRSDPVIQRHYQFWFYRYPSGDSYLYTAANLRRALDAINFRYPRHKKIVLIGYSMGGCISRLMIIDSGRVLWNAAIRTPPDRTPLSPEARKELNALLIFKHRPEVGRVIFISTPHRGSAIATNWLGRIGSALLHASPSLERTSAQLRLPPNSIDTLAPDSRLVKAINTLPVFSDIPFNSIIGDCGKGGNKDRTKPMSSDGIVPYWSSHLDGAESEFIAPLGHFSLKKPQVIDEVLRILKVHAGD